MTSEDEQERRAAASDVVSSFGQLVSPGPQITEGERPTDLPVPSEAQRESERLEVRQGVERVLEKQRRSILQAVYRVLVFATLPVLAGITFRQVTLGRTSVWFWLEIASLVSATVGAGWTSLKLSTRGAIVAYSISAVSIAALLHFGPLLGVGLAYALAVLFAALLLSPRQAYVATSALAIGIYLCALSVAIDWDLLARTEQKLELGAWLRLCASSTIALFTLAFVFLKVQSNLWNSLANQISLHIREKKFVEEREKMVRTAGSVQRLESLGRLAGGIAHDFNNSLVVIQCGLDALDDELDASTRGELLAEINDGVSRAAVTSRQLLSFAKRNVEEMGACDPKLVAERIEKDASRLLPASIKLTVDVREEGAPRVGLSETAIEQLLLIVIQNSQEALGERAGQIRIILGTDDGTGGLFLRVTDDGPGMNTEVHERAWEPFFTTKGERHPGLGLSTLWATVRRHGGDVTMESRVDSGTRVTMIFPPAPEEQQDVPPARPEPPSLRMSEMTVLILEDEAPIRTALRRILRQLGLKVEVAETVAQAREKMGASDFALLISDGVLPDGGVGQFIRDFGESQQAPVILCSGYLEEDLALDGIAKGQCSFLPKPFTADELSDLVRSLLSAQPH